jgi:FMN phosphatase YigB (HAD superfamily)
MPTECLRTVSLLKKEEVLFWDDDPDNVAGAKDFVFNSRQFIDAFSYKEEMKRLGLL